MDLREKKTLRSIHNAFLELRAKKPLERITVKELCERAEISKATFYLHYRDIYDLSEQLQLEVIRDMVQYIKNPRDIIDQSYRISHDMVQGFYANQTLIGILFRDSQFSNLPEKIEGELKNRIFQEVPELRDDVFTHVQITYQLMGCFYAFHKYEKEFGFNKVLSAVDHMSRQLSQRPST